MMDARSNVACESTWPVRRARDDCFTRRAYTLAGDTVISWLRASRLGDGLTFKAIGVPLKRSFAPLMIGKAIVVALAAVTQYALAS